MAQKNLAGIVIALLIGLGVGFVADRVFQSSIISDQATKIQKLQSQIERAKKFFPPEQAVINTLSGTIKSVSGNTVVLDANLPNPFTDLPNLRTIRITDDTTIIKFEQKDQVTLQKEYIEFQKKTATGAVSPSPFRQTTGTIADLKKDQSVTVTADGDIATKESFDARAIHIIIITPARTTQQPPSFVR